MEQLRFEEGARGRATDEPAVILVDSLPDQDDRDGLNFLPMMKAKDFSFSRQPHIL